MRLWHKDLISYLPHLQLVSQWRECCCIAKNIANNGTPNHLLVNKIMDYPLNHFYNYTSLVLDEFVNRGYKYNNDSYTQFVCNLDKVIGYENYELYNYYRPVDYNELFKNWHNNRYLRQCLFNLQEKADCNGITIDEWQRIKDKFGDICNEK